MRITLGLILTLLLIGMLVWRPPAGAQINRPKPTPAPTPRPRPSRPTPTPRPTPNIERAVWNTIKTSNDPAVFDNFLRDYPNGEFALEALFRRAILRAQATSSPADSQTFEFETVRLDSNGKEIERRKLQARYFTEDLGNGGKLEMVEIPGGSFQMGSPANEAQRVNDEGPQHTVNVPAFWMGKFEITQRQWMAVMGKFTNEPGFRGDDLPVERVSWNDAQEFLIKLNTLPNLRGRNYRLPTEAEWEYAARAGTTTPFAFGETITPQIVNYDGNYPYANAPKGEFRQKTVPVGSLGVANPFGLFDMHGNVWEWCQDVWHENYNGASTDGSAWLSGGDSSFRVVRGGSWNGYGDYVRSAFRNGDAPGFIVDFIGFRVVCARTP